MYVVGYNQAGFLPEEHPTEHDTFDEAKRALIEVMLTHADQVEDLHQAETLDNTAQDVNLWSEAPAVNHVTVGEWVYWITLPARSYPAPAGWQHPRVTGTWVA